MGVRGLQTYVEKQCPAACKTVSLQLEADAHRKKFNCVPELVVDGMSFAHQLYCKSNLEWIYGGQWVQFLQQLNHFIVKFRNIGVELVFFFDGTVSSSKREEWVKRRVTKYEEIASIFSALKENFRVPYGTSFYLPTSTGLLTAFALKELGAKVFQTDREADDEIVKYAHDKEEVFGILSQDSDFMIYNTKEYYSLSHLNFNNLQTIHYDRRTLAHTYLNLEVKQLPLFACLIGNHFVPFEKLRRFHRRLVPKGPIYVAAIASKLSNMIRIQNWTGNPANRSELECISQFVFGNYDCTNIQKGLNSYALGESAPPLKTCLHLHSFEKEMFRRHIDCSIPPHIFNLLCKLEYGCSEVLEDTTTKPSGLIYREIRQRCYSVLFNLQPVTIKEWCAYHGNHMVNPELIKPLPLKKLAGSENHLPSIDKIWFSSSENEKLKIFWSILQLPMEFDVMLKIPKRLWAFSCIINFLIGGSSCSPHLKPSEVAIFVAQAVWEKSVPELEKLQVPWVDAIAVNLSTLFMRGVATILMVLGTCGNPFPITYTMPWHFYDGKLFHYLYTTTKTNLCISDLCRNKSHVTEEFYNLLAFVTSNTMYDIKKFDWKSIIFDFK